MKVFFNRTQLARKLQVSPETLGKRIAAGLIAHDAEDALGSELFSENLVKRFEKIIASDFNKKSAK